MSEKRLYDVIDKEEPRGQSVSYQGIPCTARHCCTNLNRLTEENEQLKKEYKIAINEMVTDYKKLEKENEQLKKENNDYEKQFRIINEKLDEYIKTADTYRIPISSLEYGDDLGYFNGVYQYMKKLKKDIGGIGYE